MDARSVYELAMVGCICGSALPAGMLVVVMTQRIKTPPRTFIQLATPVIESLEPGENWRWCYVDDILAASEIDEDDTPFERESVMSNDTLVLDRAAAKDVSFHVNRYP